MYGVCSRHRQLREAKEVPGLLRYTLDHGKKGKYELCEPARLPSAGGFT